MRLFRALHYSPVAAVGLAVPATARAGAVAHREVCTGPEIIVEQQLSPAWRAAAAELVTDLTALNDWDRCAIITLLPAGSEVIVQVALQDGRAAVRRVHGPSELSSTVEALLVLPPAHETRSAIEVTNASVEGEPEAGGSLRPLAVTRDTGTAHFELGLAGDARASGSPLFWGAGALFTAQVSLDGWLLAAEGRWDVFDTPVTIAVPAGFNMQTFAAGVAIGRRLEGATLRADVLLGPELLVENEEADGPGEGVGGSTNDVRVHLTARLLAAHAKNPRWFGALDVDASPARIRRARQTDPGLPTSPAWSAGLGVGLLWEVR